MKKFMAIIAAIAIVAFAAPAFAANPFADVPAGHWAYDAVAQLAADGLISGYPDGAFKGERQATRYEVAAMVARATAKCESGIQANKKDIELLKKLMVEFKDELDALGAKTDKLDKRVTSLEKGIGSWKISGRFIFDSAFSGGDNGVNSAWTRNRGKYEFTRDTARMFFRRQITEDTYFDSQFRIGSDWAGGSQGDGRGDSGAFSVRKFYVGTKLPFWGLQMKIGRTQFDFEGMYDLYDYEAMVGDWRYDGFWFTKNWDTVQADFIVGRNHSGVLRNECYWDSFATEPAALTDGYENFLYAFNLKWTPNDKFTGGIIGYWMQGDGRDATKTSRTIGNVHTYGVTAGYKFTPNVALKGIYYWQDLNSQRNDVLEAAGLLDTRQNAWKVILDIKQNALKYTDFWIEYCQMKNGFGGNNAAANGDNNMYTMGGKSGEPSVFMVRPINNNNSKLWNIRAEQKWNAKWSTFLRYVNANWGTDNVDNAFDWGVGVKYKLNPAITFMLAYDSIDYGEKHAPVITGTEGYHGKDNVLLFQTDVRF